MTGEPQLRVRRAARMFLRTTAVLLMATAAMAYTPTKDPSAIQLSPGALVMGEYDWALSGTDTKPTSRCLDMVARARKYTNSNKLNFVVVHHWLPNSDGFGVSSYCYMHTSGVSPGAGVEGKCLPWTADKLAEFKKSMTLCFTEALKQGFTPYIRPYLDDGAQRGVWRNGLLFSPTTKYGQYSYSDIMLKPLAEALRDSLAAASNTGKLVTPPDRTRPVVYMAMTGEMSATVMRFSSDWASLFPVVKNIIGSSLADVKVGVGLNFNALDGVESQPLDDASTATNTQNEAGMGSFWSIFTGQTSTAPKVKFPANVPEINAAAVKDLLSNKADFLGISAYYPYTGANFQVTEFESSARKVAEDLADLAGGLNIVTLADSGKLELHYGEFGIGCGVDGKNEPSASADACAKAPWAGICGVFNPNLDPWQRSDLANFRTSFYDKAFDWLSRPSTRLYKIKEVFVWSMSSWDVLGLYPDSMGYRDIAIARKAAAHDTEIIAAQVCKYGDKDECDDFVAANAACLNDQTGAACLNRPVAPSTVTEAGPAQSSTNLGTGSPAASQGQPEGQVSTPDSSSTTSGGSSTAAPASSNLIDTAAAPAPSAAVADPSNPNIVFVGVQPIVPYTPKTTNNNAIGRQIKWAAPVVVPVLCAGLMFR